MNFDRRYLEAFSALVRTQSFGLAARELNISRSALSQRIAALESVLGTPLLVRDSVVPTPPGEILLHHCQAVTTLEFDTMKRLKLGTLARPNVAIAVNADCLTTWFEPIAYAIAKENVAIEVFTDNQIDALTALARGEVMGWLSKTRTALPGFAAEPIGLMEYECVGTPALAKRYFANGLKRESVVAAPAVLPNRSDPVHEAFIEKALGFVVSGYVAHCFPTLEARLSAIRRGIGYGLVPTMLARTWMDSEDLVGLAPQAKISVDLYWHHWTKAPPTDSAISKLVMRHACRTLTRSCVLPLQDVLADLPVKRN